MLNPHRKKKSGFLNVVKFLNSKEIGYEFTSKDASAQMPYMSNYTVYIYISYFHEVGFLEKIESKPHKFKLKYHIPDELNTTILYKIRNEIIYGKGSWKDWFIKLDDRIKLMYEEKYGQSL